MSNHLLHTQQAFDYETALDALSEQVSGNLLDVCDFVGVSTLQNFVVYQRPPCSTLAVTQTLMLPLHSYPEAHQTV